MGILNSMRVLLSGIIEKSYCAGQYYGELRKIRQPWRQERIASVQWSPEEEKAFKEYWKENWGKEIAADWHKLYQSYTGKFRVDYFPEYLFSSRLEPLLDKNPYNDALEDKNLLHLYDVAGGGKNSSNNVIALQWNV